MKVKKIAIIHFQPIELYPPILNLLDLLNVQQALETTLYTTKGLLVKNQQFYSYDKIVIKRYGWSGQTIYKWKRYFFYFYFNTATLLQLILQKPDVLFYYETFSAWPSIIYKKYFNKKVKLFIHYHEYMSDEKYNATMQLLQTFHKLEKPYYKYANWISHTNPFRLDFFSKENNDIPKDILKILPNYPPSNWYSPPKESYTFPIKFVFVGSLGMDFLYLKEMITWIENGNGQRVMDFYGNAKLDVVSYFKEKKPKYSTLKGAVEYKELKKILPKYNIGVILYKSEEINTVYCAPNKLFEYLICGLDVWFSDDLIGCYDYATNSTPKAIKINFKELHHLDLNSIIERTIIAKNMVQNYTYEEEYKNLLNTF